MKKQTEEIFAVLLAAGFGSRLRPLTNHWPKCLMPIGKKPLLEIWFDALNEVGIKNILVNLHTQKEIVTTFLNRPIFNNSVVGVEENTLLGTAGTLRENYELYKGKTVLFAHADNLCLCNWKEFIRFHCNSRPHGTTMTMMTFETDTPQTCGIVERDSEGRVRSFHEKVENPPGNLANGAVYLLEPEVVDWVALHPNAYEFSTDVIPNFIGKIATWKNDGVLKDIGNAKSLKEAQKIKVQYPVNDDNWQKNFENLSIISMVKSL